jgi:hypothetical protein
LRSYRAHDVSKFAVTNDESESATLMATRRFSFAKPGRFVSSPCSLTSTHGSTALHEIAPSHLSHAPSHLRGIFSFDTSDNRSGHYGDACCASEIGSHRSGILVSLSYWVDRSQRKVWSCNPGQLAYYENSEVVRIRRSDHASVSSHMLSDPVPSGRAVIRSIAVFSSANDAVVPIPETEGKYYEVPEDMEMSGCDNVFKVILTVHIDVEELENKSRGSVMLYEA